MDSKMICKNVIENVNFKLMSNDDEKQYQQLYVDAGEISEVIPVSPCDYFATINAVIFSKTLEEVKERFSTTWAEYAINSCINSITKINGDD